MVVVSAPVPLTAAHNSEAFDCGEPVLDDWLKRRELKNENNGASRTFVVCQDDNVVGYYVLATGSVMHKDAPSKIKHNMPEHVPVMVLGRLAVDKSAQSMGIGRGLKTYSCMHFLMRLANSICSAASSNLPWIQCY